MSSHASLSAAADDRKARLAKLKSLKRKQPTEDSADDDQQAPQSNNDLQQQQQEQSEEQPPATDSNRSNSPPTKEVSHLHLSLRNYDPETKGPKLGFEAPPTLSLETPTLEEKATQLEEESKRHAAQDSQGDKGIDLFKLQPKKPNWDLKRELDKKLAVLNVQTDNAIARMVRERLEAKKAEAAGQADAASGKQAQATQGQKENGEDGAVLLEGAAMVEGIRLREEQEAEEERRERELEEAELA